MALLNDITVKKELRLCKVDEELPYSELITGEKK